MKKKKITQVIFGSKPNDYDDSSLELYGIKPDGSMDEKAKKEYDDFEKSIANNPKRKK